MFALVSVQAAAQSHKDSVSVLKEYTNLAEALLEPEKVVRLNLSNQQMEFPPDSIWAKFKNLEFLSLKNDRIAVSPGGISNLKRLKILDLSGNDFYVLPQSFSGLVNLVELYLNDERAMDYEKSLLVLKDLPNLKILHLENDNLQQVPSNIVLLKNLEFLYLNNNKLKSIPAELKGLKNLNYLDVHDNEFNLYNPEFRNQGFGFKIRF
jgi:Leucine-rich repeat (LRR) protein